MECPGFWLGQKSPMPSLDSITCHRNRRHTCHAQRAAELRPETERDSIHPRGKSRKIASPILHPEKVEPPKQRQNAVHNCLTGLGLDLGGNTLRSLLRHLRLTAAGAGSGLGLLRLLLALRLGLLLLAGLDGLVAGSLAGLRAQRSALLDHIERSTNDGTLGLDGAAGTLLGNLLWWASVPVPQRRFLSLPYPPILSSRN